ncbi:MAG: hypothetical protein ACR2FN_13795 [Chitinophagaceae bacterium]
MNQRMQNRLDAMNADLSLTPDQKNQITQIFTNWQQQRRQLKQANDQQQLHQARRAMKQSVENILTPDQKQKYSANESKYWQAAQQNENDAEE